MNKLAIQLLRAVLVVLLFGSVLAQVLLPVYASAEGMMFPEFAYLVVPYSVAGILFVGCVQVALLVVWRLLSLVNEGVIFTRPALRWIDVITVCAAVATVLSGAVMFHLLAFVGVHVARVLWLAPCIAGGLAFALLTVVMRGLLESAIANRTELDEVI